MNGPTLRQILEEALFAMAGSGLIAIANSHKLQSVGSGHYIVKWIENADREQYPQSVFSQLEEYRFAIRWQDYSALLNDGSFIQLHYELDSLGVAQHRLCFFRSPTDVDVSEVLSSDADLLDVIDERIASDPMRNLRPFSVIRFDYNRGVQNLDHPECHMTTIRNHCRIPTRGPLSPKRFLEFVFDALCAERHLNVPELTTLDFETVSTITTVEQSKLHFNWHV